MFKKQYILTNKNISTPKNWLTSNFGDFELFVDSELNYTEYEIPTKKVALLGYVFHAIDNLLEEKLIERIVTLNHEEILDEVDLWCGHFILFVKTDSFRIYNDACASFKIFYGEKECYKAIGSDPKVLTHFLKFEEDKDSEKKKFYSSDFFKNDRTKIGHDTRFENMYQLVANHFLQVENLKSVRSFPRKGRIEISQREAGKKLIRLFQNIIFQIDKRYTIYTSITAGFDSRLLVSATHKIAKRISYYTFKLPNEKESFIDYTIPRKIATELDLNYSFIYINNMENSEKERIEATFDFPRFRPFQQYQNIFPEKEKPNILLVGFVCEVAKNYLERVKVENGKDVVRAVHLPDNKYLNKHYQKWLKKNRRAIEKNGYELLDFIHWEQDITNFAGQNTFYANHCVNLFSVFNCREVLEIMLAVSPSERDGKSPRFFKYLIKKMWPELLNYPFNPSYREKIILFMKKIKVYPFYKYLQIKFHKNGVVK